MVHQAQDTKTIKVQIIEENGETKIRNYGDKVLIDTQTETANL